MLLFFPQRNSAAALLAVFSVGVLCQCKNQPSEPTTAPESENLDALPPITSRALLPADGATAGSPLFEKLTAEQTGIDFVHTWSPDSPYEAALLKTGFTGGGVCLADYDRDGHCDVFLTRPHGGPELYRNLGGFKFEKVTVAAGLKFPSPLTGGCSFADVDNDGWLDLYVCTYGSDNQLFLNQRDGTFRAATGGAWLNHIGACVKTVFADYDLDGDLDAFMVTHRKEPITPPKIRYEGTEGNYTVAEEHQELVGVINLPDRQQFVKGAQFDRLWRNELVESGELGWTDVSKPAGITGNYHGFDAIWWDYNDDRYPDLYIANDFTDPDQFLRNNGDGTFTDISKESLPHTPWFTMGSAAADFNGDGLIDLLATDMSATTHFREKVAMGSMERVAWFLDWAEPRQYMRNALFLNSGTERFMEAAFLSGLANSDWTWSVKAADLDNDGREDVFCTNGFSRDYNDADFAEQLERSGDQRPDAWQKAPELHEENVAFRNRGNLQFSSVGKAWGLAEKGISFGAALGDLDGDGDLDLVVNNYGAAPSLSRNRSGENQHRLRIELVGRHGNRSGVGAKVEIELPDGSRQFRQLHPGNGFMSADEPALHFGLGRAESVAKLRVIWPGGFRNEFENLEADRSYTIAEVVTKPIAPPAADTPMFQSSDLLANAVHRETPFDDFAVQPLLPDKLSQLGPSLAWGDIDGDGDQDLFFAGATGQAGQIFTRGADGAFAATPSPALEVDAACEDMGSLLADLDGDADLDLFVVSGGVENSPLQDRLYLNDGRGNWTLAQGKLPELSDSGGAVAAADFDRDGDLDLIIAGRCVPGSYPRPPASRLLRNDQGNFTDATADLAPALLTAGMITDATWCDVDADGWDDVVLATELGSVQLLRNLGGKSLGQPQAISPSGWWNAVEPVDVDGDGDIDLIAGNRGENSKYHPTAEKPQVILYGDFSGDGKSTIVEAKAGEHGLLPVRGKSCSSNAMPFIGKKFSTFRDFASASLEQIYTEEKIAASLRLEVTTSQSGVLVNDGTGKFEFRPLPRLAQISPVRDIATFDINGDGHSDIVLAQNFYGPQRETGRMDGGLGLVLVGDGHGGFEAVSPKLSGIVVPHQASCVSAIDLSQDGRPDLVFGINNNKILVFTGLR